jgi:hypothetical protein
MPGIILAFNFRRQKPAVPNFRNALLPRLGQHSQELPGCRSQGVVPFCTQKGATPSKAFGFRSRWGRSQGVVPFRTRKGATPFKVFGFSGCDPFKGIASLQMRSHPLLVPGSFPWGRSLLYSKGCDPFKAFIIYHLSLQMRSHPLLVPGSIPFVIGRVRPL